MSMAFLTIRFGFPDTRTDPCMANATRTHPGPDPGISATPRLRHSSRAIWYRRRLFSTAPGKAPGKRRPERKNIPGIITRSRARVQPARKVRERRLRTRPGTVHAPKPAGPLLLPAREEPESTTRGAKVHSCGCTEEIRDTLSKYVSINISTGDFHDSPRRDKSIGGGDGVIAGNHRNGGSPGGSPFPAGPRLGRICRAPFGRARHPGRGR